MTYTSNELAELSGFSLSNISVSLKALGFTPVGITGKNQNVWDEECLDALLKKRRQKELESTIHLGSLATAFHMGITEMRELLESKGIKPVAVEHKALTGNLIERYPIEVREVIIKQFDDLKVDKADEHPLVMDKRCLKLNWWPDIIPKCFEDLDDIA